MIRNVVMCKLREAPDEAAAAADRQQAEQGIAGIAALRLPGLLAMTTGRDAGLRDGGWSYAIVNDWADADAYRAYDLDEEHNRFRAMIGAVCSDIGRVQFVLD